MINIVCIYLKSHFICSTDHFYYNKNKRFTIKCPYPVVNYRRGTQGFEPCSSTQPRAPIKHQTLGKYQGLLLQDTIFLFKLWVISNTRDVT
jgi:hypothetical protein